MDFRVENKTKRAFVYNDKKRKLSLIIKSASVNVIPEALFYRFQKKIRSNKELVVLPLEADKKPNKKEEAPVNPPKEPEQKSDDLTSGQDEQEPETPPEINLPSPDELADESDDAEAPEQPASADDSFKAAAAKAEAKAKANAEKAEANAKAAAGKAKAARAEAKAKK